MNLLRAIIRSLLLENDANEDDLFSPQQFETDKETAFAQMEDLLAKELGVEFAISQEFKDIIPPFEEIDIQKKKYAIRKAKPFYLKRQTLANPLLAQAQDYIAEEKKINRPKHKIAKVLAMAEDIKLAPFDDTNELLNYLLLKNLGYKKQQLFQLKGAGYDKEQHKLVRNQKRSWIDAFQPYKNDWNFLHHVGAYSTGWKQEFLSPKGILDFISSLNSKDELSTIAVPKSAKDVLEWDSLFEEKVFAIKLAGFCTGIWDEDSWTTTFANGNFGGQKANSGFSKYGYDQAGKGTLAQNDAHFLSQELLQSIHTGVLPKVKHGYYEATLDNHKVVGIYFNHDVLGYFDWLANENELEEFEHNSGKLIETLTTLAAQGLKLYGIDNKTLTINDVQEQLTDIYERYWEEEL